MEQSARLLFDFSDASVTADYLDGFVESLTSDLEDAGAKVERETVAGPGGAKGPETVSAGVLLALVARPLVRGCVDIALTWLRERRQGTVRIVIDGEEITLTGLDMLRTEQPVIDALIKRHESEERDGGTAS